MRYYRCYEEHWLPLHCEWIIHCEESIEVAYAKIDIYAPHSWSMYNEGKDSRHNDSYNQGHLEEYDNTWEKAKE